MHDERHHGVQVVTEKQPIVRPVDRLELSRPLRFGRFGVSLELQALLWA
jgi:hypothetical protein